MLPWPTWRAASPADRRALAALAIAVVHPARARDGGLVEAVLAAATGAVATRSSAPDAAASTTSAASGPSEATVGTVGADHRSAVDDPDDPVHGPVDAVDAVVTDWGGVWFLLHAIADLELADRLLTAGFDPTPAVAQVVAALTGAPRDDPGVAVLAGRPPTVDAAVPPTAIPAELPTDLLDELSADLAGWIDLALDWGNQEDGWLWRRRGVVRTELALVEIEFPRSSVDVDVHVAGLDVDPGWVWWLGAFVRFRYV